MEFSFSLNSLNIKIDTTGDFYGKNFWINFAKKNYEPDTISFIERNCNASIDFLDIGAANGAMTLTAAAYGAKVYAYEPNPFIFAVAKNNAELNTALSTNIELINTAISSESGKISYDRKSNSEILSDIVFSGDMKISQTQIEVLSLVSELDRVHENLNRKLVIKMDIEGAEWKILKSESTLISLQKHKALMLLALHPGFYRPFKKRMRGLDKFMVIMWHYRNIRESAKIFDLLSLYGGIYRTNLNPISNKATFCGLTFFGYHEFVIDFSEKP
jgi:FkbM family methyltransferase